MSWKLADIIDFEFLLFEDESLDDAALRARDRQIAAGLPSETLGSSRSALLLGWLEARRAESAKALPGEIFQTGWRVMWFLSGLCGLVVGAGLAAGWLLAYRGVEPVNVGWFFACTVGLQWLILVLAAVSWLWRRTLRFEKKVGPLQLAIAGMLWMAGSMLHRLPGSRRERLRAAISSLRRKRDIYRSVWLWPIVVVTQIFGVFFNVGILAALALPLGRDVAFGWQSTLPTSPEAVHQMTAVLAVPWSFAAGAHPSLPEIRASRFSYAEALSPSPSATRAWWAFLAYSILFYGLIIRLSLLVLAGLGLRTALRRLRFDHPGCNALWRRLAGSLVDAQPPLPGPDFPESESVKVTEMAGSCAALVAEDVSVDEASLHRVLKAMFRWDLMTVLSIAIDDPGGNPQAAEMLRSPLSPLCGVAVVIDGQRPPIRAIALVLQKLVDAAGSKLEIVVLLKGSSDSDLPLWRNFLAASGLHLGVERWQ